jgi:hypothetical protein
MKAELGNYRQALDALYATLYGIERGASNCRGAAVAVSNVIEIRSEQREAVVSRNAADAD